MGTQLLISCLKEDDLDFPPVPPGFEDFASLKLQRPDSVDAITCLALPCISGESQFLKSDYHQDALGNKSRSFCHRHSINYRQFENSSDDGSDCEHSDQVTARWHPEAATRLELEDAPEFYPNEEEFQDPIEYIARIRPKAETYGICRIIPPPSWKPPCLLKEKHIWEHSKFATRIQRVDKLQNRGPTRKLSKLHNHQRKKRRRCSKLRGDCGSGVADILGPEKAGFGFQPGPEFTLDSFQRYGEDFKVRYFGAKLKNERVGINKTKLPEKWEPSVETIEGEYWRMVEKPAEEIEVLYGADLDTGVFGSGFPKVSSQGFYEDRFTKSGWNLNNLSRLPGSVLSYESADISGVHVPWLYIGMCFSSFCWHVEDHHLYSLSYMHFGAPKLWYGVPGKEATNMERAMKRHLPHLFEEEPDLLHKLVTQLSPSVLKSEGVPVYRCIQNSGEFVMTFPRAYHSGFNCGFNCAEAVNVAPVDWFPRGQNAVELYSEQGRKTTISHDKLLLGAARAAVNANWELNFLRKDTSTNLKWKGISGKDGILAKSLKARIEMERRRRESLCKSCKVLKMEPGFDATTERECSICFYDLHLSAVGCCCSPDRFACLDHAKQLCTCPWSNKFFLFRYDIIDLNLLVEAVEGKLSAVYRWARLDLGLAVSSQMPKGNKPVAGLTGMLSQHPEDLFPCGATSSKGEKRTADYTLQTASKPLTEERKLSVNGTFAHDEKLSAGQFKHLGNGLPLKKDERPKLLVSGLSADVICLGDDETKQSDKPLPDAKGEGAAAMADSDEKLNTWKRGISTNAEVAGKGNPCWSYCQDQKSESDARFCNETYAGPQKPILLSKFTDLQH